MTDTMRIWDAVSKTDPKHTKKVNQRGGFTAISANYQIMRATETFGPIGIGWGYTAGDPIFHDTLCFVPVTLWHGDRSNTFGPMLGCEEWKDSKGRVDSDVSKKATTDALTKLLSQLGFNADVFLGLFDDNKYLQQVTREFAGQAEPQRSAARPDAEPGSKQETAEQWVAWGRTEAAKFADMDMILLKQWNADNAKNGRLAKLERLAPDAHAEIGQAYRDRLAELSPNLRAAG